MKLFTRLFFFYFLLLACQSFAQPSNDDCNGAIRIPLSLGWSSLPGLTVRSATESFRANPQCDNSVANIARDVWFKFTPITPTVTIQVSPSVSLDPAFEVFTSCSGPSASISCIDRAGMSGFGLPEEVTLNLVTGNTYYMRVYQVLYLQRLVLRSVSIQLPHRHQPSLQSPLPLQTPMLPSVGTTSRVQHLTHCTMGITPSRTLLLLMFRRINPQVSIVTR
jgi:hypothetical protein